MAYNDHVPPVTGPPLRVLIAEDEFIIALEIQTFVADMGHEVVGHVATGPEAVSLAEQARPDLVMMDLHLARGTCGAEAAEHIRTSLGIPVAIISGSLREMTPVQIAAIEPIAMVNKPFRDEDLYQVLALAQQIERPSQAVA